MSRAKWAVHFIRAASQGGNRLSHIYRQAFGQGITYEHDLANQLRGEPSPRLISAVAIVMDAGHGGEDAGALGVGPLPKKTSNIDVAAKLANLS